MRPRSSCSVANVSITGHDSGKEEDETDSMFVCVCVCLAPRARTLFMEHLEQHLSNTVSCAVTMVSNRKETLQLEEELQLQQLHPKYVQRLICQPRLGTTHTHTHALICPPPLPHPSDSVSPHSLLMPPPSAFLLPTSCLTPPPFPLELIFPYYFSSSTSSCSLHHSSSSS